MRACSDHARGSWVGATSHASMPVCKPSARQHQRLIRIPCGSPALLLEHVHARPPTHLQVSLMAIREGAADLLVQLLTVASPEIRAAAVFGLGCLVHASPGPSEGAAVSHS